MSADAADGALVCAAGESAAGCGFAGVARDGG